MTGSDKIYFKDGAILGRITMDPGNQISLRLPSQQCGFKAGPPYTIERGRWNQNIVIFQRGRIYFKK